MNIGLGIGAKYPKFNQLSLALRAISAIRRNGGTLIGIPDNFVGTYIDSAGTTPVTAVGDLVGLLTDRSYGAGNLGSELFGVTLNFANAAWIKTAAVTSSGANTFTTNGFGGCHAYVTAQGAKTYAVRVVGTTTVNTTFRNAAGASGAFTVPPGAFDTGANSQILLENGSLYIQLASAGTITITSISVREVLGNHASQPTTASKPVVTRVPKRLGPELATGSWVNNYATAFDTFTSTSSDSCTATTTGAKSSIRVGVPISGVTVGKTQRVRFTPVFTGGAVASVWFASSALSGLQILNLTVVSGTPISVDVTCTSADPARLMLIFNATAASTFSVTGFEIKEVLDWTNAISFDGSNDFLQTGITTGNEGWICAGVTPSSITSYRTIAHTGVLGSAKGIWLLSDLGRWVMTTFTNSAGHSTAYIDATKSPTVVSGGWNVSTVLLEVNGQSVSAARTGDCVGTTPLRIGIASADSFPLSGPMTAIIYAPVLPSAADRALIRKWIGSLQGQTL